MQSIWKWILIVSCAIGLLFSSKWTRSYWQQKRYLNNLQKKLDQVRLNNKNLTAEIHRLQTDPHAIEQIARRELGLIQPGEIEYRFVVLHSSTAEEKE